MGEQTIGILPVLFTQVALQVVLALILAGILGAFYRLYRHAYLRHWSLSWLALVAYIGASAASGMTSGGGGHPLRVIAALVSLVAGYVQVAWLLLGAWGLARSEDPPARTVRVALGLATAAGTLSVGLVLARTTAALRDRRAVSGGGAPTWSRPPPSWPAGGRWRASAAPSPGSPSCCTQPTRWPTSA